MKANNGLHNKALLHKEIIRKTYAQDQTVRLNFSDFYGIICALKTPGEAIDMIEAMIFDLDGTFVRTETLKAISYARAAVELGPERINEQDVIEAFKEVVGLSRQEVVLHLIECFGLENETKARMSEFDVQTPWQAFVQIRIKIYESMLADPLLIMKHRCPYNLDLLIWARQRKFKTGLATMSHRTQANRVLRILDILYEFDFLATRDDVNHGKPDPEIYLLIAREFNLDAGVCLVIEDSPSGVQAALAAGMRCIAVANDFTRPNIHASKLLDKRWIVDDPVDLKTVAKRYIQLYTQK
ncbi:MAG: HAD family phosphatase [Deltaproteobacteria bacterium]|nr:MAG: HAD family phosphatase [Deltaproteobacteria bacterium]